MRTASVFPAVGCVPVLLVLSACQFDKQFDDESTDILTGTTDDGTGGGSSAGESGSSSGGETGGSSGSGSSGTGGTGTDGTGTGGTGSSGSGSDGTVLDPVDCAITEHGWSFSLTDGSWVEPLGLGDLLATYIPEPLVLGFEESADGRAVLRLGGDNRGAQDTCFATNDLAVEWSNPVFSTLGGEVSLYSSDYEIILYESEVSGWVDTDCAHVLDVRISGQFDFRQTAPLFGDLVGSGDPDELCSLVLGFGVSCARCVSDGEPYCVNIDIQEMRGAAVGYTVVPVPVDDTCTSAGCSYMPNGVGRGLGWALLLMGLAAVGRRSVEPRNIA